MLALRLPFFSRLVILDIRLERLRPQPRATTDDETQHLTDLHNRFTSRKERITAEVAQERMKMFSGGRLNM